MSVAPPPSLYARWLHSNRAAITEIANPRTRAQHNHEFSATLQRIASANIRVSGKSASALASAVRAELATPGRYRLKRAVIEPAEPWWQVLWGWFGDRIGALYRLLAAHIKVARGMRTTFGNALIIVAILLIASVGARLLRSLQIARNATRARPLPLAHRQSAQTLCVEANALAQAGDYNRAIRMLFAAAITLLDFRDVLHAQSSATVNELRSALGSTDAKLEPPFVALAGQFSAVTYAERAAGAEEWLEARDAYIGIENALATA